MLLTNTCHVVKIPLERVILLVCVGVTLALTSCTPAHPPEPAATAVLSNEEIAEQLTQLVTNNLRHLSQLNKLCDNALNGGINAYHEALRDTFTTLISQPESRQLDLKDLQAIFTHGIVRASDFLPPTAQPNQTVVPQLTSQTVDGRKVILATWGNAPCHPSGHVHDGTDLYVFDTAGQVLFESGAERLTVYPVVSGWIVLPNNGYSSTELWHIRPIDDRWDKVVLFKAASINLSIENDARILQVQYHTPSDTPPCRLRPDIAATFDHVLISGGERVWVWRDNAYVPESDYFREAQVYLWPAGEMFQVLDDWRKYCVD